MAHALTLPNMGLGDLFEDLERPVTKKRRAAAKRPQATPKAGPQGMLQAEASRPNRAAKNAEDLAIVTALIDGERAAWNTGLKFGANICAETKKNNAGKALTKG